MIIDKEARERIIRSRERMRDTIALEFMKDLTGTFDGLTLGEIRRLGATIAEITAGIAIEALYEETP